MRRLLVIVSAAVLLLLLSGPVPSERTEAGSDALWAIGRYNNLILQPTNYSVIAYVESRQTVGADNVFGIHSPSGPRRLINCRNVGTEAFVTYGFGVPTELVFQLESWWSGHTGGFQIWYTGGHVALGDRNADGEDHVAPIRLFSAAADPRIQCAILEWEDMENLGDKDFNDCVVHVCAYPPFEVGGTVEIQVDGSHSLLASVDEGSAGSLIPYHIGLAGAIAGGAIAVAVGTWYARRRWLR